MNEKNIKKLIYVQKYLNESSKFFKELEKYLSDSLSDDLKIKKIESLYNIFKERCVKKWKEYQVKNI